MKVSFQGRCRFQPRLLLAEGENDRLFSPPVSARDVRELSDPVFRPEDGAPRPCRGPRRGGGGAAPPPRGAAPFPPRGPPPHTMSMFCEVGSPRRTVRPWSTA